MEPGFKRVYDKVRLLLKRYDQVKQENKKFRELLDNARDNESKFIEKIDHLQQQVLILKSATTQLSEEDKKQLEKRLNLYLKEIDKCINMLGV